MNEEQLVLNQMAKSLGPRVRQGRPLAVVLNQAPQCFYAKSEAGKEVAPVRLLSGKRDPWRYLSPFSSMLSVCLRATKAIREMQHWGGPALSIAALNACYYLAPLLRQLGVTRSSLLDMTAPPQRHRLLFNECQSALRETDALCEQTVRKMKRVLAERRFDGKRPALLHLHRCRCGVLVDWLDECGTVLCRDSTMSFLGSLLAEEQAHQSFAALARRLTARKTRLEEDGRRQLDRISPALAEMVGSVCSTGRMAGSLIGTFTSRKTHPMSLWLFLDPDYDHTGQAGAVLSAHRAHHEFILEGDTGEKFYFPPCLLAARMIFLVCQEPQVMQPLVLQPRDGFVWNHPYSGNLRMDPLTAVADTPEHEPAMVAPSGQAQSLFGGLGRRLRSAESRDLCLDGQKAHIRTILRQFKESQAVGARPDVLGLLGGLHDICRLGLTRAHERNDSPPRAHMNSEDMPYPLHGRKVSGPLADRVFRYCC